MAQKQRPQVCEVITDQDDEQNGVEDAVYTPIHKLEVFMVNFFQHLFIIFIIFIREMEYQLLISRNCKKMDFTRLNQLRLLRKRI